jgi:hypothetical protein
MRLGFVLVLLFWQGTAALRVLQVQAHADDETAFAGVLFALSHNLNATVDLLVVTDGQVCSSLALPPLTPCNRGLLL